MVSKNEVEKLRLEWVETEKLVAAAESTENEARRAWSPQRGQALLARSEAYAGEDAAEEKYLAAKKELEVRDG